MSHGGRDDRTSRVEILAHASASSRGVDDRRYRALAKAACDGFEAVRRVDLWDLDVEVGDAGGAGGRSGEMVVVEKPEISYVGSAVAGDVLGEDSIGSGDAQSAVSVQELQSPCFSSVHTGKTEPATTSAGPDKEAGSQSTGYESYVESQSQPSVPVPSNRRLTRSYLKSMQRTQESPQLSFNSVLDNRNSPSIRDIPGFRTTPPPGTMAAEEEEWRSPPEEVPDSQSTYDKAIPALSSPTRVLQLYLQSLPSSRVSNVGLHGPEPTLRSMHSGVASDVLDPITLTDAINSDARTPSAVSTNTFNDPQLPQNQTLQPNVLEPELSPIALIGNNIELYSDEPSRVIDTPVRPIYQQYGPKSSHLRTQEVVDSSLVPPTSSSFPDPVPQVTQEPPRRKLKHSSANTLRPPLPRTGSSETTSIITPGLLKLHQSFLSKPRKSGTPWYNPALQARPLRQTERGYWSLGTAAWDDKLLGKAWEALKTYVEGGSAGWGVWVVREEEADIAGGMGMGKGKGREGEWRVYCWGGIVEHIWLLLYTVSERRVKSAAARWIDGSGEVVVRMD